MVNAKGFFTISRDSCRGDSGVTAVPGPNTEEPADETLNVQRGAPQAAVSRAEPRLGTRSACPRGRRHARHTLPRQRPLPRAFGNGASSDDYEALNEWWLSELCIDLQSVPQARCATDPPLTPALAPRLRLRQLALHDEMTAATIT